MCWSSDKAQRWLLFGLVAIVLVLRLVGLDRIGFNQDEIATIHFSLQPLSRILFGPDFDNHPPLYYVFMHAWLALIGVSEPALRLPSVFMGTGAVWLAFTVGTLLLNRAAGWAGALGIGLLPTHLAQSQSGRMYEFLVVFALLSLWAMVELLTRPGLRSAFWYAAASTAMIYTQSAGVFVVVAQDVFWMGALLCKVLPRRAAPAAWWIAAQALVLTLYGPWIRVAVDRLSALQGTYWVKPESIVSYMGGLFFIIAGTRTYLATYLLAPTMVLLMAVTLWRMRTAGAASALSERFGIGRGVGLAAMIAVLPGLIMAIISQVSQPIFVPRALLPSAVACYWLAGFGLSTFGCRLRHAVGAVLALAVLSSAAMYTVRTPDQPNDLRTALWSLKQDVRSGDTVYLHGWPETKDYMDVVWGAAPRPPVLTSRPNELDERLRGWCREAGHTRLLVVHVAGTETPSSGLIDVRSYTAILEREGLEPDAPTDLGIGRVNVWRCRGS